MTSPLLVRSSACNFILASGSPRRRELLQSLGLNFRVVLPESDEKNGKDTQAAGIDETPLPKETPPDLVRRLSQGKVLAVVKFLLSNGSPDLSTPSTDKKDTIIIAADTVVVLAGKILGKPSSPAEATEMLRRLRDQQYHQVYSGLTIALVRPANRLLQALYKKNRLVTRLHESKIWMRPYTDDEIDTYVGSDDPLDKAGAYGIQHKAFSPVERLEGCFASVMGLPLGELSTALQEFGISLPHIALLCSQYTGHSCCQQ